MRFFIVCVILFLPAWVLASEKQGFDDWLADFRFHARAQGISDTVLDDAFADVAAPSDDIVELDHKQPEGTKTFSEYTEGLLTTKKIADARQARQEHRRLLKRIEAKYGVPASILVALWGIESNFGKSQGNFSVIESLATLAYDGRRSELFRTELMDALQIMQDEGISSQDLTGSWAGAMGQTQFMPSSFLKFAVDFNHDGKKDIWHSDADALASIANYLKTKGWKRGSGWGMKVQIPDDADMEQLRSEKDEKPLREWKRLGFRRINGKMLPRSNTMAHLVIPDDESAVFLVLPNYNVIMDWNHSIYFATSVGLLADAIGSK